MRLAFAAFTAVLLMVGASPVAAQATAGTPKDQTATTANPAPATGSVGVGISPKTRRKLLQDLLNAIAPPRPTAAVVVPVEPSAQPAATTPVATPPAGPVNQMPPRPATGVALTPAVTAPSPRPAAAIVPKPRPTPHPATVTASPPPAPRVVPPPPAATVPPIAPIVEPIPVAIAPAVPPPLAEPAPLAEPPRPILPDSWWLAGLLAALAAIAAVTVMRLQRARRIERTRAVLSIDPRLDLMAGATAIHGLPSGA